MRVYSIVFSAILLAVAVLPAQAGSRFLAIYNDGRVLVREVRNMAVPASGEMEFGGVPETIRPETLTVRSLTAPGRFHLLETGFRYERITASALLERSVGRELTVILPDPVDGDARVSREAVLLSAGPSPVFEIDGKLYVGKYDGIILPELPEGLDRSPVLRWLVRNQGAKQQDLEVSYLASGMGWNANYALMLDQAESEASVTGWATIENRSGTDYPPASVKLVAGEVGRAVSKQRMMATLEAAPVMAMDASVPAPQVRDVGEYHVYALPGMVALDQGATRQVRLFSAPSVPVVTELVSRFSVGRRQYGAEAMTQPVEAGLRLRNEKKAGLGMPLPAGAVRIYKADADGGGLLMGEDNVSHTAPGNEVRLTLGRPFDVSVTRTQTAYRQTGKRSAVMTWELTVRNGSDRERSIHLQEQFSGQWKISGASAKYRKLSAGAVEFELVVPPETGSGDGVATLRYTVDLSS